MYYIQERTQSRYIVLYIRLLGIRIRMNGENAICIRSNIQRQDDLPVVVHCLANVCNPMKTALLS